MKVLITGGAGYIGSILSEHLLAAGHQVHALDSLIHGDHSLFHFCANPNYQFTRGDARDRELHDGRLGGRDRAPPELRRDARVQQLERPHPAVQPPDLVAQRMAPPSSAQPSPGRFAAPGSLGAELTAAGFTDVRERLEVIDVLWSGPAEEVVASPPGSFAVPGSSSPQAARRGRLAPAAVSAVTVRRETWVMARD